MLVSGLTALDFHALLQLVLTALALLSGALLLLRKAAFRYFVVDASFDPGEGDHHRMSIGGGGGEGGEAAPVPGACAVCRAAASKKCSRCKSVWYCSQACQSKHWETHKLKCKQTKVSDKADIFSSDNGACRRRKSSGFSSISLVPPRGTCKVLQEPGQMLFPYEEFVKLFNWDKPGFLPCGLLNCGNSCFANVVLQCLTSTRPLVAYLLERDHSKGCVRKQDDWCFLCELQIHIQRASESLHPFSPINILSRLPNIGGNLGYGRQEDAHEFMRFAIDTMQSICLDEFGGEKYVDPSTQETTLIQHIFGGHLQSQVICTKCNAISNRYENMMDLTVEIQGDAGSLEECLNQFTIKEGLDGENMYKCDGCNDYVKAWKRLTVHQAPNILTIALKRFQSGRFGKLNKRVTFPEKLDLTPYMSGNGDGTDLYTLYAVVVHVDMLNASFFGHYICYTKDYQGRWYRIDDCKVTNVDVEEVLNQGAYMLLYSRTSARREPFIKTMEPAKKKHLVEVAPEASKPANRIRVDCVPSNADLQSNIPLCEAPNGMFLHRDTGHDRNLSIKSNSFKEKELENMDLDISSEIKPMCVPKYLGNMNMDYSESTSLQAKDLEGKSSISPNVREDISPVKPMQSISSSPAEISLVEVQATDCEEPCVNFDADICMEQATGTISIAGDLPKDTLQDSIPSENIVNNKAVTFSGASVATSSSVLEPYVSSDADNCMEQDTVQIGISEAAFKMSKHTPENSFHSRNFAHNMAETSCSISISTKSVSETSDDLRSNLEPVVPACGPSDSANGVNRMGDISCGKKVTSLVSCWENGSGQSKPLFSHGFLDLPVRKEPVNGNCGITHASKVNGYINGHAELDFPEQRVCENAACLESLSAKGKDILPNSDTSFISLGFLNKSSKQLMNEDRIAGVGIDKSYLPCKTNCDGSAELSSLKQSASMDKEEIGKMEIDDSDRPCNGSCGGSAGPDFTKPSVPGSGVSSLTPGFMNNSSKKLMTEDKIAKKESDKTDHPCKAGCNGSAKLDFSKPSIRHKDACLGLHSTNGNDSLPSSSMTFLSRGFLNDSYKKLTNEDRIAKKEFNRLDHPCRTNGNGFAARASVCESGNRNYRAETSLIDSYEKGPSGAAFVNGNGSCAYKKDVLTSTLVINSNAGSAYDSEVVSGRCSGDQQQV